MSSSNKRRVVPQTDTELDALITEVMEETGQADKNLISAMVCQALINQPRDEDHVAVSYLAAIVRKTVCRTICKDQLVVINQNMTELNKQIMEKNLIIQFNQDPNDMQVRDELQKLAEAGSEKAKHALGDAYVDMPKVVEGVVPALASEGVSSSATGEGSLA